ncbi:hypothetical protein BH10BDE1_BH10BDE1_05200 [soil metagenome]
MSSMKLTLTSISAFAILVGAFTFSQTVWALGPSVSGGVPPAPRAVVIQSYKTDGSFDDAGLQSALTLASQHVAQNRVVAFTQRDEAQANDRKYLCIEYRDFNDTTVAAEEFRATLVNNASLEVVSNSFCR